MATVYDVANIDQYLETALQSHHDLLEAGVTVCTLFAGNPEDAPLKSKGYPAAALAKVFSLKDRAAGMKDALIIIDESNWKALNELSRIALLDHELTHFELALSKSGIVKRDDLDRPKIKMRVHDFEMGAFREVIERHGVFALEAQACVKAQTLIKDVQGLLFK